MTDDLEYSRADQTMFGTNDLDILDPTLTALIGADPPMPSHSSRNSDFDKFFDLSSTSGVGVPPVITPGTMQYVDGVWTPLLDLQYAAAGLGSNDPVDYFGNALQPANVYSEDVVTERQIKLQQGKRPSPSASTQESPNPAAPPKKKRRERRKKVRSQEEEQRNRENFLERNRKAAQKCRQRKKVWMEEVQHKKDTASEMMNILGMEVIHLVEEVKKLRSFVSAHASCEQESHTAPPKQNLVAESSFPETATVQPDAHITLKISGIGIEPTANIPTTNPKKGGTMDKLMGTSPIGQQLGEHSDPCWKLAKEACRQFSELNPDFLPILAHFSAHDANQDARGYSIGSTEGQSEQPSIDGMSQDSDDQLDSLMSESSTPLDSRDVSLKTKTTLAFEELNLSRKVVPTLLKPQREDQVQENCSDVQDLSPSVPLSGSGTGDLKLPSLIIVS